jgi:4-aminobutyrate aminotransferase-like enzyme
MSLFSYASIAAGTPDAKHARRIVQALRERRILAGTDCPQNNVVKIKPPMLVGVEHVDRFVGELDEALGTKLPASARN